MNRLRDIPRGFTLTEVMVVVVLAGLVMLGLVAFYMGAQATWFDGSAQALTQREATGTVELLAREVRRSAMAVVTFPTGDSRLCKIELFDTKPPTIARFSMEWKQDSLIYVSGATGPAGPCVSSIVERFELRSDTALVRLVGLQLRSAEGARTMLSTYIAMQNR